MKKWIAPKRNWEGIQHEKLRRKVDLKFNNAHDALSKAFYEEKKFTWKGHNWGVLDKELFDKLHGLIFQLRMVGFHQKNMEEPIEERIPEKEYNDLVDDDGKIIGKKSDDAAEIIAKLKAEGIELEV